MRSLDDRSVRVEVRMMRRIARYGIELLLVGLSAAATAQAAPGDDLSLKGQLLVASEQLNDPNFRQTVVYLVQHGSDGAMGLVVNRVLAEGPLDRLLESLGHDRSGTGAEIRLFYGGPVQQSTALLLHSDDYRTEGTLLLDDHLALTAAEPALDDLAAGKGPSQSLLAVGHAGWGSGQLEQEIASGAWHVIMADPALLFDDDVAHKWQHAFERRGFEL
jgi:putative transcriptional regulator